jgi:hypothetical protein
MIEFVVATDIYYMVILCTNMIKELTILIRSTLVAPRLHRISGNRLVNRMVVQRMCYADITGQNEDLRPLCVRKGDCLEFEVKVRG